MKNFKVVKTDKKNYGNPYDNFDIIAISITDTRLMGVVAVRVLWKSKIEEEDYAVELFHLDFSEYGIDGHEKFFYPKSNTKIKFLDDVYHEEIRAWSHFAGSLGGKMKVISKETFVGLLKDALFIGNKYYDRHADDVRNFFKDSSKLAELIIKSINISPDNYSLSDILPSKLSKQEVANYFLMRLCDLDFKACAAISTFSSKDLESLVPYKDTLMTLVNNKLSFINRQKYISYYNYEAIITKDNDSKDSLIPPNTGIPDMASASDSYFIKGKIGLKKGENRQYPFVEFFEIDLRQRLSYFELAHKLKAPEYISVAPIPDQIMSDYDPEQVIKKISESVSTLKKGIDISVVPNGILIMLYNTNNKHADSDKYHIEGDVFGAVLVTFSREITVISNFEKNAREIVFSLIIDSDFFSKMEFQHHLFESQVFHTFCMMEGAVFSDFLQ